MASTQQSVFTIEYKGGKKRMQNHLNIIIYYVKNAYEYRKKTERIY